MKIEEAQFYLWIAPNLDIMVRHVDQTYKTEYSGELYIHCRNLPGAVSVARIAMNKQPDIYAFVKISELAIELNDST